MVLLMNVEKISKGVRIELKEYIWTTLEWTRKIPKHLLNLVDVEAIAEFGG